MRFVILGKEEIYRLIEEIHNPPVVRDQQQENLFQAEIRRLYDILVDSLSAFGLEGDHYGISDFAVGPDLRDRPSVRAPPAPHLREFTITILTKKFLLSNFLAAVHSFLCLEAAGYRIWMDQDFDPNWRATIILTADLACVYCTDKRELQRLTSVFSIL